MLKGSGGEFLEGGIVLCLGGDCEGVGGGGGGGLAVSDALGPAALLFLPSLGLKYFSKPLGFSQNNRH